MKSLPIYNVIVLVALLGSALSAQHAQALTYNVNTTADLPDDGFGVTACHTTANTCSLRAAIMKANQVGGSNTIQVPAGIYLLTIAASGANGDDTGDLDITSSITLLGQGVGRTIIDGGGNDRVLDVASGLFFTLTDATIRRGAVRGTGAGIRNAGVATIRDCVIEDNEAYNDDVNHSGAGIYSTGSLDISRCTIRSNNAAGSSSRGGGIASFGSAVIRASTIALNSAQNGGGIFAGRLGSYVYLVNSTLSGNVAYNNGAGIYVEGTSANGPVGLYNTSVIGNDASNDSDRIGRGGGFLSLGALTIVNTLIANNTINNRGAFDDCIGSVAAYGRNLFSQAVPPSCTIGGNGADAWGEVSLVGISAMQDNGGTTLTHALLQNSEAINGTTAQGCIDMNGTSLTTDQRGAARVNGFRCDVGAFEFGSVVPTDLPFINGFE